MPGAPGLDALCDAHQQAPRQNELKGLKAQHVQVSFPSSPPRSPPRCPPAPRPAYWFAPPARRAAGFQPASLRSPAAPGGRGKVPLSTMHCPMHLTNIRYTYSYLTLLLRWESGSYAAAGKCSCAQATGNCVQELCCIYHVCQLRMCDHELCASIRASSDRPWQHKRRQHRGDACAKVIRAATHPGNLGAEGVGHLLLAPLRGGEIRDRQPPAAVRPASNQGSRIRMTPLCTVIRASCPSHSEDIVRRSSRADITAFDMAQR